MISVVAVSGGAVSCGSRLFSSAMASRRKAPYMICSPCDLGIPSARSQSQTALQSTRDTCSRSRSEASRFSTAIRVSAASARRTISFVLIFPSMERRRSSAEASRALRRRRRPDSGIWSCSASSRFVAPDCWMLRAALARSKSRRLGYCTFRSADGGKGGGHK